MQRRQLLLFGGLVALAAGWQYFGVRRSATVAFGPLERAPGWEFAIQGGISGVSGTDFLTIGLNTGPSLLPVSELYQAVHGAPAPGLVPVAVFSDFFCPYCRTLIGQLARRTGGARLAISWHELPLLGPNSVLAAKAAEAAALQGGYVEFYQQLVARGFRPVPRYFAQVASEAGLDGDTLLQDMDGPEVAAKLLLSARVARTLGFSGTPGLVVGRKAILGALDTTTMEQLFDEEPRL